MIKSMTGYGRAQAQAEGFDITVEIKSVNHRYFEFSSRIPRAYGFLEEKLKKCISNSVSRGKIECNVTIETLDEGDCIAVPNYPVISSYLDALNAIGEKYSLEGNVRLVDVMRIPDALTIRKQAQDEEKIASLVLSVANEAIGNFVQMKTVEGEKLRSDVEGKLDFILSKVSEVEAQSPRTLENYRNRLYAKLTEVLGDRNIDESRILTECAVFADKIAVDEETVRLRSHIAQMKKLCMGDEPVGKKMDFVVQEMNRETNTIGSKAQDISITNIVVDMKAEIEKIREQIQNIE